jgi:hypothetical protein
VALLQSLGSHVQTLANGDQYPKPYTIGPFTQPLLQEPPPPPGGFRIGVPACPPGTYWDPVEECCVPFEEPIPEPEPPPHEVDNEFFGMVGEDPVPQLSEEAAAGTAAAIGLAFDSPRHGRLAVQIGLLLDHGEDTTRIVENDSYEALALKMGLLFDGADEEE